MSYTWSTQKSFDENKILEFLPLKMRTDIAMRVHFSTLGKVKLFRNCEPGKTHKAHIPINSINLYYYLLIVFWGTIPGLFFIFVFSIHS